MSEKVERVNQAIGRIPLTTICTLNNARTPGVVVAVMVDDLDRLEARLEAAERVVEAARGFSFNRECFEGAMFSRNPVAADLADNDYESCLTALRDALAAYDAQHATESEARS